MNSQSIHKALSSVTAPPGIHIYVQNKRRVFEIPNGKISYLVTNRGSKNYKYAFEWPEGGNKACTSAIHKAINEFQKCLADPLKLIQLPQENV